MSKVVWKRFLAQTKRGRKTWKNHFGWGKRIVFVLAHILCFVWFLHITAQTCLCHRMGNSSLDCLALLCLMQVAMHREFSFMLTVPDIRAVRWNLVHVPRENVKCLSLQSLWRVFPCRHLQRDVFRLPFEVHRHISSTSFSNTRQSKSVCTSCLNHTHCFSGSNSLNYSLCLAVNKALSKYALASLFCSRPSQKQDEYSHGYKEITQRTRARGKIKKLVWIED